MSRRTRVAIVGAGPVGLVAAIELSRRGLKPVILDAKSGIAWSSRAICISRRSLEIFSRIGMKQAFFDKALPWTSGKTFHRDRLIFQLEMPLLEEDRFAPFVNIQQFYTERYLLDTLASLGDDAAELRWANAVVNFTQDADCVRLTVDGPAGLYDLECEWLIAADGARSVVRAATRQELKGTSYEGRYLIADIRVAGAEWPVERHVWFDPASNPGSTVILHVQPDHVWRIDIQIDGSQDDAAVLDDDFLVPLIERHLATMGITTPVEVLWKSIYRAHALSLDFYREGRVLFAGDAAHLVPIFGVRGLNSGIDDAHNVAWKLAMVMEDLADERLLDSYTEERRHATLENLANAIKSTWFMCPPDRGFRVMRDAVLRLAEEKDWAQTLINPRQSSAHVYRTSSVIRYDFRTSTEGAEPGSVLPCLPLADRIYLHDLLSPNRFTLLILASGLENGEADSAVAMARSLGLEPVVIGGEVNGAACVEDPLGKIGAALGVRTFALYVVRPDEHVAARLAAVDDQTLAAVLRQIGGYEPQVAGPFVPISGVGSVIPRSRAEDVFEQLACAAHTVPQDLEQAMASLLHAMEGNGPDTPREAHTPVR